MRTNEMKSDMRDSAALANGTVPMGAGQQVGGYLEEKIDKSIY